MDALNERREYKVHIVSDKVKQTAHVKHVWAIDGRDREAVSDAIAGADVVATAVGVSVLEKIGETLREALKKRMSQQGQPLNIIICENLQDADDKLRGLICKTLTQQENEWMDENLGLVRASIGRMVPDLNQEMLLEDPLQVWVEPYEMLPVDGAALKGEVPKIKNLKPYTPFDYYIKQKLFIHNMGHAVCGYIGCLKGYEYIHTSIGDKEIHACVKDAMTHVGQVLQNAYRRPEPEITEYIDDLLERLSNSKLHDSVERICRDPIRKLGKADRLIGAAEYCLMHHVKPTSIIAGIAACLKYENEQDPQAVELKRLVEMAGIEGALNQISRH